MKSFTNVLRSRRGASLTEYAALTATASIIGILAVMSYGTKVSSIFENSTETAGKHLDYAIDDIGYLIDGEILLPVEECWVGTSGPDGIRAPHSMIYRCFAGLAANDTIDGSDKADTIDGDDGADLLHGLDGNDTMDGGAGGDVIHGDGGHDNLAGGYGEDALFGGAGNDVIDAGPDADEVYGGDGNDTILGVSGTDLLLGNGGNDDITTSQDSTEVDAGPGDDTIRMIDNAVVHQHRLTGGPGADLFISTGFGTSRASFNTFTDFAPGTDVLQLAPFGAIDLDALPAGARYAQMEGDLVIHFPEKLSFLRFQGVPIGTHPTVSTPGVLMGTIYNDWIVDGHYVDTDGDYIGSDVPEIRAGAGNDRIFPKGLTTVIYGEAGDDLIHMTNMDYAGTAYGGDGNDTINGGHQASGDVLHGGAGNDTISSSTRSTTIFGDDGNDVIRIRQSNSVTMTATGGAGNDQFNLDTPSSGKTCAVIIKDFGTGADTLKVGSTTLVPGALPAGYAGVNTASGYLITYGGDDTILLEGRSF